MKPMRWMPCRKGLSRHLTHLRGLRGPQFVQGRWLLARRQQRLPRPGPGRARPAAKSSVSTVCAGSRRRRRPLADARCLRGPVSNAPGPAHPSSDARPGTRCPNRSGRRFVLHTDGELSYREVADVLDISIGTVMKPDCFTPAKSLRAYLSERDDVYEVRPHRFPTGPPVARTARRLCRRRVERTSTAPPSIAWLRHNPDAAAEVRVASAVSSDYGKRNAPRRRPDAPAWSAVPRPDRRRSGTRRFPAGQARPEALLYSALGSPLFSRRGPAGRAGVHRACR